MPEDKPLAYRALSTLFGEPGRLKGPEWLGKVLHGGSGENPWVPYAEAEKPAQYASAPVEVPLQISPRLQALLDQQASRSERKGTTEVTAPETGEYGIRARPEPEVQVEIGPAVVDRDAMDTAAVAEKMSKPQPLPSKEEMEAIMAREAAIEEAREDYRREVYARILANQVSAGAITPEQAEEMYLQHRGLVPKPPPAVDPKKGKPKVEVEIGKGWVGDETGPTAHKFLAMGARDRSV